MSSDPTPAVPGFVVTGTATSAADTDRVTAVEEGTRRRVVLRLLPPLTADERARISGELARYQAVRDDNLSPPAELSADADALVLPAPERSTLTELDPPLRSSAQMVTVLVPVAAALAALHDVGLGHGEVGPDAVGIDADGRPRLLDSGVAGALHALAPREISAPTVADDLAALHQLAQSSADIVEDPALSALVGELVDQGAPAAVVAERLLEMFEPAPLGAVADPGPQAAAEREHDDSGGSQREDQEKDRAASDDADGHDQPPGESTNRSGGPDRARRWAGVGAVLALVSVLVVVLLVQNLGGEDDVATPVGSTEAPGRQDPGVGDSTEPSADGDPTASDEAAPSDDLSAQASLGTQLCGAPPPAAEKAPDKPDDWTVVVDELYLRRSAALVTGQQEVLCDVYDPASPGLVSDLELDAAYDEQGARPDGLVFVVEAAALVGEEAALVTLEITDQLTPYRLVDDSGDVVAELPGIGSETWQARLVPDATGTEWRFG